MPSDTEDEDDDDPEGLLEADLDKDELIQPHEVDHAGDEFLRLYYSTDSVPSSHRKKRVCVQVVLLEFVIVNYRITVYEAKEMLCIIM